MLGWLTRGPILGLAQEALHRDRVLRQPLAQDLHRGRCRARDVRRDRPWRCPPSPMYSARWYAGYRASNHVVGVSWIAKLLLDASRSQPLTFRRPAIPAGQTALPGRPRCVASCFSRSSSARPSAVATGGVSARRNQPAPSETLTRIFNSTQFYQKLGRSPVAIRCRSSARLRSRPAPPIRHRRRWPLSRKPRARVPARGERLRRALPGEHLLQVVKARRRWMWLARRSSASRHSRRPFAATRASCFSRCFASFPVTYKVNVTVRDVGSTSESRAEPISRRRASARAASARRSSRTRRRGGGT